ncbi:MAG: isopentenyl-diphosphate delta-isomerase [Bacteroidota bacterium]
MSQTTDRKKDHIDLAFRSATTSQQIDDRFYYEPMLATHPKMGDHASVEVAGHRFTYPIWVSSMTGGTGLAKRINTNLARACGDFGLGMGLGSCRKLLTSDDHLEDFAVRHHIGDQPLYANLGIAQVEELIDQSKLHLIEELVSKLQADGLIVHVNPLQEWMQPEGDPLVGRTPLQIIETLLETTSHKLIVKEVGQGMGPESLKALLQLPIAAFEFGAFGGTNFAKLEALRDPLTDEIDPLCFVGHTPIEMISFLNGIADDPGIRCKDFIISGGIKNYLDGYYYNERLTSASVYGQAAAFLRHAMEDYDSLAHFVEQQTKGYLMATAYLRPKAS